MERLTDRCWRNLDPWECCGQNFHCSRKLNDDGGCINGCIVPKLYKHLAEYEDLEEQGLLLKLPCKVGDTVYEIHPLTGKITQRKIKSIVVCNCPDLTIMYKSGYDYSNVQDDFGKTVFLTQAEAEQKLKEMESD